jgi:hypothetical protein
MSSEEIPRAPSPFDDEPIGGPAPTAEKSERPRISILHLMVWTATSAAMMAILRLPNEAAEQLPAFLTAYRIGFAMYAGVVTGGVLMWIGRWWRGVSFPTQPGEWLLVEQGATVMFWVGTMYLDEWAQRVRGKAPFLLILAFLCALVGIALVPALRYRPPKLDPKPEGSRGAPGIALVPPQRDSQGDAWQVFFWVLAGLYTLPLMSTLTLHSSTDWVGLFILLMLGLLLVAAVAFLVAVVTDLRRRIPRGWVHWTGVWSLALFAMFHVLLIIGMQIMYSTRF